MGEIADMMIDGTLCQECGAFINSRSIGLPRSCASCKGEEKDHLPKRFRAKVTCPTCSKKVRDIGLEQHIRDAHGSSGS